MIIMMISKSVNTLLLSYLFGVSRSPCGRTLPQLIFCMEGIDDTSTGNIDSQKDMKATEEEITKLGDYNCKNEVGDKNILVDCIHMNLDEDAEESESVGSDVEEMKEVYKTHVPIHKEGLSTKVWPDKVELYQPVESGQILFSEMPSCLYVQAFLRMCNLQYTLVEKTNAESIGPSGEVPVLRCGNVIVSGADKIIKFVEAKGILLTSHFKESQKSEISFYISLVQMILANAEDFVTWLDPETYSEVTRSRFCSTYPWPLSSFLIRQKKQKIQNKLNALGWGCKTFEDVCEEINLCFKALSDKLEGNYFYGNQPTPLDALVFAHSYTIMTNPLPKSQFAGIILGYPKLIKHCYRIIDLYFNELNNSNQFAELVNNLSS